MSAPVRTTILLLAPLLVLACRRERPNEQLDRVNQQVQDTSVTATPDDSLQLELVVPQRVRAGEPVRVTLRVTNTASSATDLYLRGREPTFDIVVDDESGRTVWRRLAAETIEAILLLRPLGAGAIMDVSYTWDQRTGSGTAVSPGRYTVRGMLLMESAERETAAVPLEITPR